MNPVTTQLLAKCYLDACALDVAALKPGNVSRYSAGHGMDAELFLQSAQVSAKAITEPGPVLGKRIYGAVKATWDAVRCNTNLGIILLCAPIIQAAIDYPGERLEIALPKILSAVRAQETEDVFAAIRLANPGGLGRTESHDVAGPAIRPLVEVMALAADRDLIARQYANGFRELYNAVLPYLIDAFHRHADEETAVTDLFLHLLASYRDSHIQRKQGMAQAIAVSRWAADVHQQYLTDADDSARHLLLLEMDRQLKQRGINPGTTADFCVAGVFIHRLQKADDKQRRGCPELPAVDEAGTGQNTANTISQQSEEIRYGSY